MSEIDDVISTIQERLKTELVVDYSVLLSLLGPPGDATSCIQALEKVADAIAARLKFEQENL